MPQSFREKLLDVFYDEVGSDVEEKEGEPKRLSETGEEYVEFGCRFKKWEFPKVLGAFKKTVRGYKDSVKLVFNGKLKDINDNGNLKAYWRSKPEIHLCNRVEEAEKDALFMTSGLSGDERKEAEQKIEERFVGIEKEDCSFYTRFLFTYQEKKPNA